MPVTRTTRRPKATPLSDDITRDYARARATWALRTGQPWTLYDELTCDDLDAWDDVLAAASTT